MTTRLEFATQQLAQDAADAIHVEMQRVDSDYKRSVDAGHTTAWAIPYFSEETQTWCVNVKDRADKALQPVDRARLKPILKPVVEVSTVGKK